MRWIVTLLLIVLVAAGGLWLLFADKVRPPETVAVAPATLTQLDRDLAPAKIRGLKVTAPGHPQLMLSRGADGVWSQPGNWPLRESEVAGLVNALTTMRSRFAALPVGSDLATFGLDSADTRVEVAVELATDAGTKTITLRVGRPAVVVGESEFARPAFLRVDDAGEVVRLGPDVFPLLARSPEVYRRRQLFPDAERIKLTGGESATPTTPPTGRVALLGDQVASLTVEKIDGDKTLAFKLTRTAKTPEPRRDADRPGGEPALAANTLATAWTLDAPFRDRVDPAKLRGILTAIPDLWVEAFTPTAADTGLDKPDRTLTVTPANGKALTLLIGKVSRSSTKVEPPAAPPMFGAPPPPPKITIEEFRYAKLKENELVFEVKADKLDAIFADPQEVRDASLGRFETNEVTAITIAVKGKPPVVVTRKKGNKDAEKDDERQDRWYVGDVLAEAGKATELLDAIAKWEAKGKDAVVDGADAAKLKEFELDPATSTKITVTTQAKAADGEAPPPARTFTYIVGKDDADKKKLAVQVSGWARVNLVDDAAFKLIDRPALAYRGRRLFDTAEAKLETISIKKDADTFALALKPKPAPETGTAWQLTAPIATPADDGKATTLAGDLARLEVVEFVDDAPKPDDLDKKYGLAKPRFTVDLGFTGPGGKPRKLDIGLARDGKPDAFARLDATGSVFAIPKTVVDSLDGGALALLPLQLWTTAADKVTAIEVRRGESAGNESYKLAQTGTDWKLTGPFDANASLLDLQPLLAAVATVKADKYDALQPDPAKHGLDKPALRLAVSFQENRPNLPGPLAPEASITKTLLVGKETTPGAATRFAMLDGGPTKAVFVIPDAVLKDADKPALARLDKTILTLDPGKIAKVQIAGPTADSNVTLTKDDKGVWKADGAAFTIDTPIVTALVSTASRPPVVRLAAYGPNSNWATFGLDKPEYTVTVTLTGDKPETHVLKVGKAEPNGERPLRTDDGPAVGILLPRAAESLARGKLDFVDRTLLNFDPAVLTGLIRKKGKDEFELAQAGLNWEVAKPAKQKADKPTIEDLADQLSRLRAVKVAAVAPADLAPFGLKEPEAELTFAVGPEKKVLKLGKPVEAGKPDGDRFALTEGTNPIIVGVIPGPLAKKLLAEPLKFRDKALAKFLDADKLVLARGDRTVTFEKPSGTWKVTAPVMADAEQADLDELVNALANLRADELAADKPADLKPFGLDKPEAKWTITAGRDEVILLLGSTEKETGRVFARLGKGDKQDLVALLDPVLTGKVTGEYRKRAAFADLDAAQVESIAVSGTAGAFVLLKDPTGWRDPTKPGEPIDGTKVTETLAALAGLKAERYAADAASADQLKLFGLEPTKARAVIAVTQKGGVTKTIQIGGPEGTSGGKKAYAKLPDSPAVMVLTEADAAKLLRDRAAYAGKK